MFHRARAGSVPEQCMHSPVHCIPAAYFVLLPIFAWFWFSFCSFIFVCILCFCYIFFCILAKLRLTLHGASSSTHSRALVDKKLQISIRKARSLQDRMQQQPSSQQPVQPSASLPPQGGAVPQLTR